MIARNFFASFIVVCASVLIAGSGNAILTWQIGPFTRPTDAPVITPDKASEFSDPISKEPVHWEALHTFNPAAVVRNGKVFVLYRAEDDSGEMKIGMHTSRLGLAQSSDGIHFTRDKTPVFYPAEDSQKYREWPGGVEDPRIVEREDGTYVLAYTQWNRKTYDIGVATSTDLIHWTKHGPIFGDKLSDTPYKSSGIVTHLVEDRLIAAKINGKYWMYWGEITIRLATSEDLVHWTPQTDHKGDPITVLEKRPEKFDSSFPETGPPPVLTDRGIVFLYNGKNDPKNGDPKIGPNAYAVGEALFDKDDPSKLLSRTDQPVFKPELAFEKTGQYAAGTTFAEGLVLFKQHWLLYYGCADSNVGVAVAPQNRFRRSS
ncbi:MAG: glycoside hydrolase family 130 protein [Acidobacteriota bacterium]|nr:glycoside hydrolase family 130 protein [Acidobacteriota bacterium]